MEKSNSKINNRSNEPADKIPTYNAGVRIQKALSQMGIGSRRSIEKAIQEQKVLVNDQFATVGQSVISSDRIVFDGKLVRFDSILSLPRILIYHKPDGEIVSENDPKGRPTVFENLPKIKQAKWIAIGRLDFNTSGLLIFTSYGELANRFMHPRYEIEREYSVRILGELNPEDLSKLTKGVALDDGLAKFESISFQGGEGVNHWYQVILKEGRNREVRRMFESLGMTVSRLIRIRFGDIKLPPHVKRGMTIELGQNEVRKILKKFDIDSGDFIQTQIEDTKNKIYKSSKRRKK
jgi:23S rRNA pseudouridine2605 synthase